MQNYYILRYLMISIGQ